MDLGRRGPMAARFSVVQTVSSFIQASRVGIVLRPPPSRAKEVGLLEVAVAVDNRHPGRQPRAVTHSPWARNDVAPLAPGATT